MVMYFQFPVKFKNLKDLLKRIIYHSRVWLFLTKNSLIVMLSQRSVFLIFLTGKALRFVFFIAFLYFLVKGSGSLAGYNSTQAIFFFLTYMVVDTTSQFFFREVYRFRTYISTGDFDLILVKPMNSLFRVLLGGADAIDLVTLPFLYAATIYVGILLSPAPLQIVVYFYLVTIGFLISLALHIVVIAFGIISMEVDHTIMIYRDLSAMGRFPTDIYKEPLRSFLTFVVPVTLMMTLPAKALFQNISAIWIILPAVVASIFLFTAFRFWNFALKRYTSASS